MGAVNKRNGIIVFLYMGIIISLSIGAIYLIYRKDLDKKAVVLLNGSENYTISLNQEFVDEGVSLRIDNKEISLEDIDVEINSNVNKDVVGKYEIDYNISYDNKTYNIKRYIEVVDDVAPEIIVNQDNVLRYVCKGESKINLDYQAYDNYDGILTDKVSLKIEDKYAHLSVKDSFGNIANKEIPIIDARDSDAYIINLNGKDLIYISIGGEYVEEGATITDGCGVLSDLKLDITGTVDTNTVGVYQIKYSYKEEISKIRKVVVYEKHEDVKTNEEEKVIYLTFDDGPGQYTEEILDILKKYDVKATFFVTNQFDQYIHLLKREDEEGHAIGVHTLTHKWKLYQSLENYLKDFNDMNQIIFDQTGKKTDIFRFPGGSSNTISEAYAIGVVGAIASKMTENGYVYFDWNVDSEDATGAKTEKIIKNVIAGIESRQTPVILMHDLKKNTVAALEKIIKYGLDNGYTFKKLSTDAQTCHHKIKN